MSGLYQSFNWCNAHTAACCTFNIAAMLHHTAAMLAGPDVAGPLLGQASFLHVCTYKPSLGSCKTLHFEMLHFLQPSSASCDMLWYQAKLLRQLHMALAYLGTVGAQQSRCV
jgi:hypothetical protein